MPRRLCLVLAILVCGPVAAAPRDELLRLVPPGSHFVAVIDDLRATSAALASGPFAKLLNASPLGQAALQAPEWKNLGDLDRFLAAQLGLSLPQLRDDVLGDRVVLAYHAGPPGKPDQDFGVLLTLARDPERTATALTKLHELQQKNGELKDLASAEHRGQKYTRRVTAGGETQCFWQRGNVFAVATREDVLRKLLDQDADPTPSEPPVAKSLRELGATGSLLTVWLNPRAFDAELTQKAAAAKVGEAEFLRTFRSYWSHLDAVALALRPGRDLELQLAVRLKTADLPEPARRFLTTADAASPLWSAVPPDAIAAIVGRFDLPALTETVAGFLTPDAKAAAKSAAEQTVGPALGRDRLNPILAALGPDLGVIVTAPPAGAKAWWPRLTFALRVRDTGPPAAGPALLGAADFAAQLLAFNYNREHDDQIRLERPTLDGVEVRTLVNPSFPSGFQPALALKAGFLVVASHPDLIRAFKPAEATASGDVPWLRISAKHLAAYLRTHRAEVSAKNAADKQQKVEDAGRELDNLVSVLDLFDRLELVHHAANGTATVTAKVTLAAPLTTVKPPG